MTTRKILEEVLRLSVEDRLQLVDAIWNTIDQESRTDELTPELKAELDRRLEDIRLHPDAGYSLEEAIERLEKA